MFKMPQPNCGECSFRCSYTSCRMEVEGRRAFSITCLWGECTNNEILVADKTKRILFSVCYERFMGPEEEDGIFNIGWLHSTIRDLIDLQDKWPKQIHQYNVLIAKDQKNQLEGKIPSSSYMNSIPSLQDMKSGFIVSCGIDLNSEKRLTLAGQCG